MPAHAALSAVHKGKRRLLESCAVAAGLMVLAPGAHAQVAATPLNPPGSVTIGTDTASRTTTVGVSDPQTIINWVPTDTAPTGGDIDVLPENSNWNFNGSGNYIVLNRFVNGAGGSLSRRVALNGTISSSNVSDQGGSIWFYNGGGILIGANAEINVGSLLLTANDIDTTGGFFDATTGAIRFRGSPGSLAAIAVSGEINANQVVNPGSSYVALVAPRIVQAGRVEVDGSVAYVAAEAADIRINTGLFDINVLAGAEGGNAITHTGITTGPSHIQGSAYDSRIHMVAIAKNDAVTMLVSGQVGYRDAITAQTDPDGAVRLSAGYNIAGGEIDASTVNGPAAHITVGDVRFLSNTTAHASGAFLGQSQQQLPAVPPTAPVPERPGEIHVEGEGLFIGDASAALVVGTGGSGQSAGADGNLTIESSGATGNASVTVRDGGSIFVGGLPGGGLLAIRADGRTDPVTGINQGGTATFSQSGGRTEVGNLVISAVAEDGNTPGGTGRGGVARAELTGGELEAGDIAILARGGGGFGTSGADFDSGIPVGPAGTGGTGYGGTATMRVDGADVQMGAVLLDASGRGGSGGEFYAFVTGGDAGDGGNGIGGSARFDLVSGTISGGALTVDAHGEGGSGGATYDFSSGSDLTGAQGGGGLGQGGTATLGLAADTDISDLVMVSADALGGVGGTGYGAGPAGRGGNAQGGTAQLIVTDHAVGSLFSIMSAEAVGGAGGFSAGSTGANGGNAVGGTARLEVIGEAGSAVVLGANLRASATGGEGGFGSISYTDPTISPAGGAGGTGTGGTQEIIARDGATVLIDADNSSSIAELGSVGTGGAGGRGAGNDMGTATGGEGGAAGTGVGGTVHLLAAGGTITTGSNSLLVGADGTAGAPGEGGFGTGGDGGAGGEGRTAGGRVLFEATTANGRTGELNLGFTGISASGDDAGRVVIGGDGRTTFADLSVSVTGMAAPTAGNLDTATTGILLAPTGAGSIATTGDMRLTTDGSVGIYAAGGGHVAVGGTLDIAARDQIDLRHSTPAAGGAPTIAAVGNATLTAANGITGDAGSTAASDAALALTSTNGSIAIGSARAGGDMALSAVNGSIGTSGIITAGDDMRITAASMALGRIEATGSGVDSEADGANIVLTSTGAATVVHAEAAGDFAANVGSFATGLNSIVTGGDIVVASPGTVDLGNSSAGGFVSVNGQSIAFNTVSAGSFVSLTAEGTGAADGVFGTDITAGGTVAIDGPAIAVGGTIQSDGTLRATASTGGVAIGLADTAGNVIASAGTNLSGIYRAGGNVELTAGGNVTAEADAAGGYADPSGNTLSEGYVFVDAGGDATLTDSSAATMIGIRAGGAASLTGGTAGEDVFVLAGTTATLANVTAGDDLIVQAGGAIDATDAATTGTGPDGRSVVYAGGGSVPVPFLQIATTPADLSNVALTAGTDIAAVRVGAFDNLIADAGGAVTGSVIAGGNLTLIADGSIAIDSAETGDDGAVTLSAGTGIDADEIYSRGVTTLTTDAGAVRVGNLNSRDAVSVSADSLDIGTNGPITFANIVTDVGDAAIRSGNRFIVENATIAGTARFDNSGEHMIIEALTADAAQFNAAEMISMTNVSVTNGLAASAGTTILVDGAVTGRDMTLASRDITIAPTGRLGTLGITRTLSLANNDDGRQSFVGGTGTVAGYHIDADEMTRLHAAAIEIIAPMVAGGGGEPDLVIDGFTMTGGASSNANLGADGSLTLRTPGRARVIGAVALTDFADANSLTVAADTALEVILGQGSVRLSNGSDPAGRLNLAASAVFVVTQAAIGDIAGAASIDAIDARLAENDGVTSDEGALFAGGINAAVGDGFYVQNSGAGNQTAQRRGLTFGALGLNVDASAPTARIVVNGVGAGASGPVTGLDTIPLLTVNGAAPASGSFDRRSTLNGCLILNTGTCLPAQSGGVEMNFPVQDVIEEEASADSDEGEGSTLPTPLITMRELDPMTGEPLLDDPVTGAGNDDLWTSPGG
ncbi:hypothetical protein MNQ96_06415 [Sphingopyxis granuli]|uniref:hypothetical protein n=1 Tax=Sphingopyxis granuli TaxID=267128 RepID=UPI001F534D5A|nr:hypothetical protein [Sphingopyxis granuli]UNK80703.1 hypothetical protein MNQ96_06415 [Sphingopyxis granuli]